MKKLLLIFVLFPILTLNTYAECFIASKEADALSEYYENTTKLLQKLSQETRRLPAPQSENAVVREFTSETKRVANAIVLAYNRAFDFSYVASDFKFTLELPVANELPKEVRRDYKKLKAYHDTIQKYFEEIIRTGKGEKNIKSICDDSITGCRIADNQSAKEILALVVANHKQVSYIFEQTVTGNKALEGDVMFVGENFLLEMQTAYGAQGISSCNSENEFLQSIRERTGKIAALEAENKNAIQEWKDAWELLQGTSDDASYREIEKRLLKAELSRQGVSSDNQTTMLRNLDQFNQSGLTAANNPITNTLESLNRKVENEIYKFKRQELSGFLEGEKQVGVTKTLEVKESASKTKERIASLAVINAELELYAAASSIESENLINQLINSHIELSESINILEKSCKKAVELCNRQAASKGNCGTCN